MANTFTGLKLQGDIGKFGKIEMTDIDCFCHLPDGKVVSGAGSGSLLVWEGQFIKCQIVRPGKEGGHDGPLQYISLDRTDWFIITGGADGYIRWWSFEDVDTADSEGDSMCCELTPVRELFIGKGIAARCVERSGVREDPSSDHFLITDGTGALWRAPIPEEAAESSPTFTLRPQQLACFHSGAITGLDTSYLELLVATCGVDGTVRIWDFLTKAPLEMAHFLRPAQCLEWANDRVDPAGQTVAVGFSDGVVRVLVRNRRGSSSQADGEGEGTLRRAQTLKPHDSSVVALSYSPDGNMLASIGKDCKLFFIKSYLTEKVREPRYGVLEASLHEEVVALLECPSHEVASSAVIHRAVIN